MRHDPGRNRGTNKGGASGNKVGTRYTPRGLAMLSELHVRLGICIGSNSRVVREETWEDYLKRVRDKET